MCDLEPSSAASVLTTLAGGPMIWACKASYLLRSNDDDDDDDDGARGLPFWRVVRAERRRDLGAWLRYLEVEVARDPLDTLEAFAKAHDRLPRNADVGTSSANVVDAYDRAVRGEAVSNADANLLLGWACLHVNAFFETKFCLARRLTRQGVVLSTTTASGTSTTTSGTSTTTTTTSGTSTTTTTTSGTSTTTSGTSTPAPPPPLPGDVEVDLSASHVRRPQPADWSEAKHLVVLVATTPSARFVVDLSWPLSPASVSTLDDPENRRLVRVARRGKLYSLDRRTDPWADSWIPLTLFDARTNRPQSHFVGGDHNAATPSNGNAQTERGAVATLDQ